VSLRPYREVTIDLRWASPNHTVALIARGEYSIEVTTDFPNIGLLRTAGTDSPVRLDGAENSRVTDALLCPQVVRFLAEERRRGNGARLRLRLTIPGDAEHAPLRAVPWELSTLGMSTETGFTGAPLRPLTKHPDVQIVRTPAIAAPSAAGTTTLAGKVLLASAYTVSGSVDGTRFGGLGALGTSDIELAEYELANTSLEPERVLAGPGHTSVSGYDLRQAIGGGPVAGFYFAGHGADGLVVAAHGSDGDESPEQVTAEDLAGPLVAAGTQVVILMACDIDSASNARARRLTEHRAFAERLSGSGIPWVVSAHGAITNGAAARFAPAFLRVLAAGADVDEAAREGSDAMGDGAGLIVVHCSAGAQDLEAATPDSAYRPILARVPGRAGWIVNPDLRWGLRRHPVRGVLWTADPGPEPGLVSRLNRAEEIVRLGTIDVDPRQPCRRRAWFLVEATADPDRLLARPPWGGHHLRDAPDGDYVGLVVVWDPESGADGIGHLAVLSAALPNAAIVLRISGSMDNVYAPRLLDDVSRALPGSLDFLTVPASDPDAELDAVVYADGPAALTQAAAGNGFAADPDVLALAALRHLNRVGRRAAWSLLERGVATEVRVVAEYLTSTDRSSDDTDDLAFLCGAEPRVVAAAWRAGIQPEFMPSRLPQGAHLLPGCWTLLARSRPSRAIVRWLYEIGQPLASITGLLPESSPDVAYETWLEQAREAYGLYRLVA
jgi:hypothetical protein